MAGYLAGYGAGEERKSRLIRNSIVYGVAFLVAATLLYFGFRNYKGRAAMDSFLTLLEQKNYAEAYKLWGCSVETPCRNYSYERFQRDWGPDSQAKNPGNARIVTKATCGGILVNTGLLRVYEFTADYTVNLWFDKSTDTLGFAPIIQKMQCTVLP